MPSPKSNRRIGHEKNKKGRLSEKASSFHGRGERTVSDILPRPRTVPDLLAHRRSSGGLSDEAMVVMPKLTKLLLNVTIQRSPGAVQVVIPPESTVKDLIAAAIGQYAKEARRPVLPSANALVFDLHYSQFSLESLGMDEKLISLGSRNFFLCPKSVAVGTCSKEADEDRKKSLPWLKFMDFLL